MSDEVARWRGQEGQWQTGEIGDCLLVVYPHNDRWHWEATWDWADIRREASGSTPTEMDAKQAALNAAKELADGE